MRERFRKTGPKGPDFFAAEAAGLAWLAAGGAPTVEVLGSAVDHIDLEQLRPGRPSSEAARALGAALARTHDAGADTFGSPPDGFSGQLWIGRRRLSSVPFDPPYESWGAFYAAERVLPYAEVAVAAGNLDPDDAHDVRRASELITAGAFDDGEPPSRIHGDLWGGNVMWTPTGAVLIDPAAHGGHRETDLAMLALFGCPHLDDIIDGYESVHPLRGGWQQRVGLHQLHPLAVHAAGHGPAYGSELGRAARGVLALA